MSSDDQTRGLGLAIPLASALIALSFLTYTALQTVEMVNARNSLSHMKASQESTVKQARALRQQLQALAGATAQLANDGDAPAQKVVDEMAKQGIKLKPTPSSQAQQKSK